MRGARLIAAGLVSCALAVAGCGGDDPVAGTATSEAPGTIASTPAPPPTAAAPEPAPPPPPEPLAGLPGDTAGYEAWDRINADPIPDGSPAAQRVGFDAHGGTKNVYVTPGAERGPDGWPDGTIVVKAAGDDPGAPTLIAIMRKIAGSDAEHGDWEFVEYKRDSPGGTFATSPALRDATCWSCHARALDTDWVFTADDR